MPRQNRSVSWALVLFPYLVASGAQLLLLARSTPAPSVVGWWHRLGGEGSYLTFLLLFGFGPAALATVAALAVLSRGSGGLAKVPKTAALWVGVLAAASGVFGVLVAINRLGT